MLRRKFLGSLLQGAAGVSLMAIEPRRRLPAQSDVLVKILGTAQDGGLPQLGCFCPNCRKARVEAGFRRAIASLAIWDLSERRLFLVDVTPDIRLQLDLAMEIPGAEPTERSKIPDAVVLTHAHIGHYTGLIFFGYEAMSTERLPVYCSDRMASFLKNNGPWSQLVKLENITLHILPPEKDLVLTPRVSLRPFTVPHRDEFSDTLGLWIRGTQRSLLYIPDIQNWPAWKRPITREVARADIALLDGTFFSSLELPGRDLSKIGHPRILDSMQTLQTEADRGRTRILFTHLNHSNPVVDPSSRARQQVKARGFAVAEDGMEFAL